MNAPLSGAILGSDPIVVAGVAVVGIAVGFIISDRTRLEGLGLFRMLLGVVLLGLAVAGVWALLEFVSGELGAILASALTVAIALGALYLAGGSQRIALLPFAVEDEHAVEATLAKDTVVPVGLETLPPFSGKVAPRPVATAPVVWWEGGEEEPVSTGTVLDDAQIKQAPAVVYVNVAKEDLTYRDPRHKKHVEAGGEVNDELAALHEFQGRTRTVDGKRTAIDRTEYRDPNHTLPIAANEEIGDDLLLLPEVAEHAKQVAKAARDFTYFKGATKRTIEAGAPLPANERAAQAAIGRNAMKTVTMEPVTYRGRRFAAGDIVPPGVGTDVTRPIGVRRGVYLRKLVVGDDGRWSTSKLQVLLWTMAVLFILLALLYYTEVLQQALNGHAGTDTDKTKPKDGVGFPELEIPAAYYILLGGPFAAAILAKTFTATKTENGTLAKTQEAAPSGPIQGLNEVISDDAGRVDLVDLQYFAFNLIALGYVIGAFVLALTNGFPEVPDAIFGLTGAAALAYTTKKATDRLVPTITNVSPRRVRPGDVVDIWGQNLVLAPGTVPRVEIDGRPVGDVEVVKNTGTPSAGRRAEDHLRIKVPPLSGDDTAQLVVVPEGGRPTDPEELQVDRGAIDSVDPQPLRIGRDDRVLVRGRRLADDATARVSIGGIGLDPEGTPQPDLVVAKLRPGAGYETGSGVRLMVETGERSATRLISVEKPRITGVGPATLPRKVTEDITITGTALATSDKVLAKLGGYELRVESRDETQIVARMRRTLLDEYPEKATLSLVLDGETLTEHPVTVAPKA